MISLKMHPKEVQRPVDMKSMILAARQTDRHTKNNTASASAGCKNLCCETAYVIAAVQCDCKYMLYVLVWL